MNRQRQWAEGRTFVDRGLRLQVRVFLGIFVVMLALVITRIVRDDLDPLWMLVGFAVGLVIGVALARIKRLSWSPSKRAVVGTIDVVGGVILAAYLIFLVFRNRIIGSEVSDAGTVEAIGLAMTGGAMLGRVCITLRGIRNVLNAAGIEVSGAP